MPGLGGDRLCRLLKEDPETSSIPLLALTSSKREADLLDLGFDDYVVKPARIDRLKARVAALLRRGNRELARRLAVGQIELDSDAHGAWVKGRPIKPTPTEFKLLELLMRNKGRVLTYSTISQNLWSLEETVFKHSMETHLNNLRSKLGGAARQIETVKGVGYKLVP
jgi:DNA-binding response OmpR family regulator